MNSLLLHLQRDFSAAGFHVFSWRASAKVLSLPACQPACAGDAGRGGPQRLRRPDAGPHRQRSLRQVPGCSLTKCVTPAQSPPPPAVWPPPEIFPPSYVPVPAPGGYGGAVAGEAAPPRQQRRSLRHLLRRAHMRRLLHNLA